MRVFAGPNGSGKSTIINAVRKTKVNNQPVDFGIYINADDIAKDLRNDAFHFKTYTTSVTEEEFKKEAIQSGLINNEFTEAQFLSCYFFSNNKVSLTSGHSVAKADERIAQILAHFLRKKLLQEKKKLSFETVFSHTSKLDIMREAKESGYKVYLYFVSTESPEINKFRVEARKNKGGHDVDPIKIEQRYYRSLDLLFEAAQLCYQVFFIDNSKELKDGEEANWFAHFKIVGEKKKWDKLKQTEVAEWFKKYYSSKVRKKDSKNQASDTSQKFDSAIL